MLGMKGSCVVLLALGGVVSTLWVISYYRAIELRLPVHAGGCGLNILAYRGLTQITAIPDFPWGRATQARTQDGRDHVRMVCWDEQTWDASLAGFSYDEGMIYLGEGVSKLYRSVTLPLWVGAIISLGGLTCRARRRWVEHRRAALGQCIACGYDLRGLKIDCPACAALMPPSSSHLPVGAH